MANKKSTWGKGTWGKSADWNAPKRGAKKSTWGTPEDVARAVSKRGRSKSGNKVRKLFGPLF